ETYNLRFYIRDRHYLDPTPLCFWCRSLFRRLWEIQGFYYSPAAFRAPAAFHFTPFQPLRIQPLWIQRLRLWICWWGWSLWRAATHHYSAFSTANSRPI